MDECREGGKHVYEEAMIWPSSPSPVPLGRLVEGFEGPDSEFLAEVYTMSEAMYSSLPPRKNGEPAFTHPTNAALFLRMANAQAHVVAGGLLHDVMEDRVDLERGERDVAGTELLQSAVRGQFGEAVIKAAERTSFPREIAERLVEVVWTLTRHKADMYYKSISGIFTHPDESIRLAAALVKLADRMHNIQTIENYDDDEKIYQCFKNLFILNNAKQLRNEVREGAIDPRMLASLEKMFKKCGKSTFLALHRIDHQRDAASPVFHLVTYLALALRKYTMEVQGLWKVTDAKLRPGAPVYTLFHGIVNKYDKRLHHELDEFHGIIENELYYLRCTFADLGLDHDEYMSAVNFKDAMAMKEVIASLLYRDGYVIRGFECSRLCRRGRNCIKALDG